MGPLRPWQLSTRPANTRMNDVWCYMEREGTEGPQPSISKEWSIMKEDKYIIWWTENLCFYHRFSAPPSHELCSIQRIVLENTIHSHGWRRKYMHVLEIYACAEWGCMCDAVHRKAPDEPVPLLLTTAWEKRNWIRCHGTLKIMQA